MVRKQFIELYHSGILGMKWGIRRYQNDDGSLTEEGRLRYGRRKSDGKYVKLNRQQRKMAKKMIEREKELAKPLKERNIGTMSDEELVAYISRMQLEKTASTLRQDVAKLNPKEVSKGEKIAKYLLKEASKSLVPALENTAKNYIEKKLKEELKIDEKKEKSLKEESQDWINMANIATNQVRYYENMEKLKGYKTK